MATATVAEIRTVVRKVIGEQRGDTDEATLKAVQRLTKLLSEQVIPRLPEAPPEEEPDPGDEEPDLERAHIPSRHERMVRTGSSEDVASALDASAVSGLAAPGVITCNPAKLLAKARAHEQKASDYRHLWHSERNKTKPSRAKLAYYRKKSIAHELKGQQYRARLRRCENADNQ